MDKLIKYARKLYSADSYTPENLAKESGLNADKLEYIKTGLIRYVDVPPIIEPDKVARDIEKESAGLVDYKTMLAILINFMKEATKAYENCQKSDTGSRRAFAVRYDLDWTYFELFYCRNDLLEQRGNITQLPILQQKISDLEKKLIA